MGRRVPFQRKKVLEAQTHFFVIFFSLAGRGESIPASVNDYVVCSKAQRERECALTFTNLDAFMKRALEKVAVNHKENRKIYII